MLERSIPAKGGLSAGLWEGLFTKSAAAIRLCLEGKGNKGGGCMKGMVVEILAIVLVIFLLVLFGFLTWSEIFGTGKGLIKEVLNASNI